MVFSRMVQTWKARVQLTFCLLLMINPLLSSSSASTLTSRRLLLAADVASEACPCGSIYTVRDGETLQIVSAKCHAPFILADNPHVQDTDDVAGGSLLKISCFPSLR